MSYIKGLLYTVIIALVGLYIGYLEYTLTTGKKLESYRLYSSCVSNPMPLDLFSQLSGEGIALLITNTVCDKV